MKNLLTLVLLTFTLALPQALASGSDGKDTFSDVPYTLEGLVREDLSWFASAVMNMAHFGIITGYEDKTFRPYNTVSRAEVATLLNRFYERFIDTGHKDWERFTNERYSVWSPVLSNAEREQDSDACSSYIGGIADRAYPVFCETGGIKGMEFAISKIGSQFSDDDSRRESRWEFMLNGQKALRVVVTAFDYPEWYAESVFVLNEDSGDFYQMSNGAVKDPNFEYFYQSFKIR